MDSHTESDVSVTGRLEEVRLTLLFGWPTAAIAAQVKFHFAQNHLSLVCTHPQCVSESDMKVTGRSEDLHWTWLSAAHPVGASSRSNVTLLRITCHWYTPVPHESVRAL